MVLSPHPELARAAVEVSEGGVLLRAVELHQLLPPGDTSPLGSEPGGLLLYKSGCSLPSQSVFYSHLYRLRLHADSLVIPNKTPRTIWASVAERAEEENQTYS